jgi:hypothetical protein
MRIGTGRNVKSLVTIAGQVLVARTALSRLRQARGEGDRLELLDALVNVVALVSGTIVIIRRLRSGKEEA